MTHELIRRETSYSRMMMSERMGYANMMAGAGDLIPRGLFDNSTGRPSPAKVFLVFETGSMLGLEPMAALQGIDVIEGSATLSPRLVLALIRAAGYRVVDHEHGTIEANGLDYGWTVEVFDDEDDPDMPMSSGTFTLRDAVRAGLCTVVRDGDVWKTVAVAERSGKPLPWQQYPSDMTYWRALGRIARRGFSHVTLGIAYMPEELTSGVVGEDGTRQVTTSESAELIAEVRQLHDRADIRTWWKAHRNDDACTPDVRNAMDAHLLTVTRDSAAERRAGAPGNTGIAELDVKRDDEPSPDEEREHEAEVDAAIARHEESLPADDEGTTADEQAAIAAQELTDGEKIGDDPDWTGAPCSVCGLNHGTGRHYGVEAKS